MSTPNLNPVRERHWICAQRLRERRLALGLTQRELADRLREQGGITTNRALSAMENGRGLDLGLLPELAASLGCSITYLLGLASDPAAWHPDGQAPSPQSHEDRAPERIPGILGPDVPVGFVARAHGRSAVEQARTS
jgi:transcriptional regulator with XRE-family HTH domain